MEVFSSSYVWASISQPRKNFKGQSENSLGSFFPDRFFGGKVGRAVCAGKWRAPPVAGAAAGHLQAKGPGLNCRRLQVMCLYGSC